MKTGLEVVTPTIRFEVPAWVAPVVRDFSEPLSNDEACMALCVRLSAENVKRGGGPFGACVFLGDRLLAAGVNLVQSSNLSIAHAEIVTLMASQQVLAADAMSLPALTLFTSTDPCCQCFGALVWAGVRRLVCGAATEDAEAVGFDEGPKPEAWPQVLEQRGIDVKRGVLRAEARAVLQNYAASGGAIYGKPKA